MSFKFNRTFRSFHFGMGTKLSLAICSIVCILLVSSTISIAEFRRMSTYVSDRISDNITTINRSTALAVTMDEYNLKLLSAVGKADILAVPDFTPSRYVSVTDSLIQVLIDDRIAGSDSLAQSYAFYINVSLQLDSVMRSDFIDAREWYFSSLQPAYSAFRTSLEVLNEGIYEDLHRNSISFDDSFYRGIMPGVASVTAGIILCFLLLFFILVFYVRPLLKMLKNLESYRRAGLPYHTVFDGDDALQELNFNITELTEENTILKKRLK